ncbi:hypothetical protein DV738_g1824, partial [Chaetothyriales sp. CBS 135597]
MSDNPTEESQDVTPRASQKRSAEGAELEIDVNAPEPPSKKARRKAKKQAPTTPEPDSNKEEPDLKRLNGLEKGRSNYGIWIGNLAFTTSKKAVYDFLTKNSISGDSITRLHLPPSERNRMHNKGFAYVDFTSQDIVESAVQLSENLLEGRRLLIKDAKNFQGRPEKPKEEKSTPARPPSRKIFIGNLDFHTTVQDVEKHFGVCGPVLKTQVASFEDSGKCKGYGWIEFESLASAESAMKGWVEVDKPTRGEDGKKTMKPKKVWLHRMGSRQLRLEYAEDATTRYKKRFGADSSTAKPDGPGDDSELVGEDRPEAEVSSSTPEKKNQGLTKGKKTGPRTTSKKDAYSRYSEQTVQKLTGGIVQSEGHKPPHLPAADMPPPRSRRLAPRRRRADEAEEESSTYGDIDDDSLSEGSTISGADEEADGDASDASVEEEARANHGREKQAAVDDAAPVAAPFSASAETEAMLNGLKISDPSVETEELHFDDTQAGPQLDGSPADAKLAEAPSSVRNEMLARKSRRDHQEYIKERNSNPAFVPNRGGFFLHDDRSDPASRSMRMAGRGRGRAGHGQVPPGRSTLHAESSEKQWTHDLHDKHENPGPTTDPRAPSATINESGPAQVSSVHKAPNRNFSFTTVIGNVSVNVSMPGIEKKTVPMVKRHHTLLPQHRPPLRRDKPVRISVPDAQPRYIFPSAERSFIFIPRALRPNQQSNTRGRGRGSFHGSRRTSIYGGSNYSPSVAMSRKSSIGGPVRDLRSPAAPAVPRAVDFGFKGMRPVVRMPVGMPLPGTINPTRNSSGSSHYGAPMTGSLSYGFHSTAIPMHQPRPQKAVSVGAIESPASFAVKGPQHQYDQPFHQQMPQFVAPRPEEGPMMGGHLPGGALIPHLHEGAMYVNPFQPMPMVQEPIMYGNPYYVAGGMQFAAPMPGMPLFQSWAPVPPSQAPMLENVHHANAMGNEASGMVFYNGAIPPQVDGQPQQQFMMREAAMTGVPTMMNPQAPYYYPPAPPGTFYPTRST